MNNNDQPPAMAKIEDQLQKWEKPFQDLMDEIYFQGYTKTLAEDNPDAYELEYSNFLELYDR